MNIVGIMAIIAIITVMGVMNTMTKMALMDILLILEISKNPESTKRDTLRSCFRPHPRDMPFVHVSSLEAEGVEAEDVGAEGRAMKMRMG